MACGCGIVPGVPFVGLGRVPRRARTNRFAGLGAAALSENLSAAEMQAYLGVLKTIILESDKAIYNAKSTISDGSLLDSIGSGVLNVLTLGAYSKTRDNIRSSFRATIDKWETDKKTLWAVQSTGAHDGRPITRTQAVGFLRVIGNDVSLCQNGVKLVQDFSAGKVLAKAVLDTIGQAVAWLAKVAQMVVDAIAAVVKGLTDLVGAAGKAMSLLPLVVVGLLVVPLLLRTGSAYKRGGGTAAMDEAAGQLERGRSRAWSATKAGAGIIGRRLRPA